MAQDVSQFTSLHFLTKFLNTTVFMEGGISMSEYSDSLFFSSPPSTGS